MKLEHYLPELEPPSGGLDRLRDRLKQDSQRPMTIGMTVTAALATLLVVGAILFNPADRTEFNSELRQLLTEASQPEATIDGLAPTRSVSRDGQLILFMVEDQAKEQ